MVVTSSFISATEDRVNCYKCLNQDRPQEWIDKKRQNQSCFNVSKNRVFQIEDINYYTCIGNLRSPAFGYLLNLFNQYDKHGCDMDNTPAKLVEAFNLIENLRSQKQEAEARKQKQRGKRN